MDLLRSVSSQKSFNSRKEGVSIRANLTRYNPFNEVISLRDAMDRLFEDSFISRGVGSGVSRGVSRGVAANLYENAEGYILQVPMPGTSSEDIEITAQQDMLTLKWETKLFTPEGATTHWNGFHARSMSNAPVSLCSGWRIPQQLSGQLQVALVQCAMFDGV